jgi:hypothetical protein
VGVFPSVVVAAMSPSQRQEETLLDVERFAGLYVRSSSIEFPWRTMRSHPSRRPRSHGADLYPTWAPRRLAGSGGAEERDWKVEEKRVSMLLLCTSRGKKDLEWWHAGKGLACCYACYDSKENWGR